MASSLRSMPRPGFSVRVMWPLERERGDWRRQNSTENERDYEWPFVVVDPGDVLFVHFDLWHRVSDNTSDRDRYMMKFLFKRTEEATVPSWNAAVGFDPDFDMLAERLKPNHPSDVLLQHPLVWDFMWRWMRGEVLPEWGDDAPVSVDDAMGALLGADYVAALDAAYSLGRLGKCAVPALMDVLLGDDEDLREIVPAALSAAGAHSVDGLVSALAHRDDWVRATATDTLADIGLLSIDALPDIRKALGDENDWVRHNAANALAIWGKTADVARDDLVDMLRDREPFVGFNALTALEHMGCIDDRVRMVLKELRDHDHTRLRYQVNEILQHVA